MKDDTALRVRRYCVYAVIIVGFAVFLAFLTKFFWAVVAAKRYFHVP